MVVTQRLSYMFSRALYLCGICGGRSDFKFFLVEIRGFLPSSIGVPYPSVASSEMYCRPDYPASYNSACPELNLTSDPTLEQIQKEEFYNFLRPFYEVRKCTRNGNGMPAPVHQYVSRISAKFGIAYLYQKLVGDFNFRLRWKPSCL